MPKIHLEMLTKEQRLFKTTNLNEWIIRTDLRF